MTHRLLVSALLCLVPVLGCGRSDRATTGDDPLDLVSAPMCGDGRCDTGETCQSCAADCGRCPACNYAPSCDDAAGAPAAPTPRIDLCVGTPATMGVAPDGGSGPINCQPAQVRLRLQKIHVNSGGGKVWCLVTATDGTNSEVALTPKSPSLGNGQDYFVDPSAGMFWGQKDLLSAAADIEVHYQCFLVVGDTWAKALMAAGNAAMMAAGYQGQYGWAFGLAGAAANVAAAALAASSGDNLQLDVRQTISRDKLLDLTNGRYFTVQQSGNGGWSWTLFVEAWGCALGTPQK